MRQKEEYLSGYYKPKIEGSFEQWTDSWSMGACAEIGWVWFEGYYTEDAVRKILENPDKENLFTEEDYKSHQEMFDRLNGK